MAERKLTAKQQRFVDVYDGNGTAAARAAGYSGDDNALAQAARALLRNTQIAAAIRERQNAQMRPHIATREERQAFWSQVLRDGEQSMSDRLRAAELLGKSEADFVQRVDHSGTVTLEQLVVGSREGDGV